MCGVGGSVDLVSHSDGHETKHNVSAVDLELDCESRREDGILIRTKWAGYAETGYF